MSIRLLNKKSVCFFLAVFFLIIGFSGSYQHHTNKPLTMTQLMSLIQEMGSDDVFHITATPEVLKSINKILATEPSCQFMQESLDRMQSYESTIEPILTENDIPADFIALPLMESHYKVKADEKNSSGPAGIWQITPGTAKMLGLTVNHTRDDRLDVALSTAAVAKYFNRLYAEYHDWNLVLLAYNIGDGKLNEAIKVIGSEELWPLVRSSSTPQQLTAFVAVFHADVVIMHHPYLLKNLKK